MGMWNGQSLPGATSNKLANTAARSVDTLAGRRHELFGNKQPRWMTVLDRIPLIGYLLFHRKKQWHER